MVKNGQKLKYDHNLGLDLWSDFEQTTVEFVSNAILTIEENSAAPEIVDELEHINADDLEQNKLNHSKKQQQIWAAEARIRGGSWLVQLEQHCTQEQLQGWLTEGGRN